MSTALTRSPSAPLAPVARAPLSVDLSAPDDRQFFTTFNVDTPAGRALFVRAIGTPDSRVEDHIGHEIAIVDIVAQVVTLEDENTGQEVEAPRVGLILADGSVAGATSNGVLSSLKLLRSLYGLPSADNPYRVLVRQVSTRKGRRTFELLPVEATATAPKSSKRAK